MEFSFIMLWAYALFHRYCHKCRNRSAVDQHHRATLDLDYYYRYVSQEHRHRLADHRYLLASQMQHRPGPYAYNQNVTPAILHIIENLYATNVFTALECAHIFVIASNSIVCVDGSLPGQVLVEFSLPYRGTCAGFGPA